MLHNTSSLQIFLQKLGFVPIIQIMQTITSRDVQTNYGSFTEAVTDDTVCVTRHGRPLYYAISARQTNPELFIGRMLLTFGQTHADTQAADAGGRFADFVQALGHTTNEGGVAGDTLTEQDVAQIVDDNRL